MSRLTPAQRHLQRLRDQALQAAVPAPAAPVATEGQARAPVIRGGGAPSIARQVLDRKLAAISATREAANDNEPTHAEAEALSEAAERAALSAYDNLRMQLVEHRRILSETKSVERKVALKREFLPLYAAWILGVLESGAPAEGDEIITYAMIWALDIGDYSLGLELVEHHIRHRLQLPEKFRRDLPTYAAETIAEAAIKALTPKDGRFPHGVLGTIELLVKGCDMPDEVSAKLAKAQGLECVFLADNPPEGHASAGWRPSQLEAAIACYRRALELDDGIGVKRAIELLERDLKKEPTA